ncbi:MAG: long-chain-fatty-acid--CoA ligase [Polyangia bacterium]
MRALMQDTPLLISSMLDYAARFHADSEVISREPDGSVHRTSWGEVARRAKQLARALQALGIKAGDRVATLAWNTHRHLELYYAVSGLGAVLHTVNPRLFPEQLTYIINHAEDKLLFFDVMFAPLVEKLRPELPGVERLIALTDARGAAALLSGGRLPGLLTYDELCAAQPPDFTWPELDERTASSLCYTSGTTGHPKGVLYSHRSTVLHSFAVCAADALGLSCRDSVLLIVPMFHANAWGIPYAAAMCGAKLVLPGHALDGPSVCELLQREACTLSLGVPTVWLNFLAFLDQHPDRKPQTLRRVVIGGSAAPRALIARMHALGVEVHHLWGMTETSPVGTCGGLTRRTIDLSPEQLIDLKVKQGRALYGVEIKIVDDTGRELARDGRAFGLVKVRGPWTTSGYFKGEGGQILDEQGWFPTGDVATLDEGGYLQITDRAKDVIKSGGEWISSIDLENAAVAHPAVHEAAVIGVRHPVWQERPLLLAVKKPGAVVSEDELIEFLAGKVAKWWLPDEVQFVSELPHTATGKLHKLKLREQFKDYSLPETPRRRG